MVKEPLAESLCAETSEVCSRFWEEEAEQRQAQPEEASSQT